MIPAMPSSDPGQQEAGLPDLRQRHHQIEGASDHDAIPTPGCRSEIDLIGLGEQLSGSDDGAAGIPQQALKLPIPEADVQVTGSGAHERYSVAVAGFGFDQLPGVGAQGVDFFLCGQIGLLLG